MDNLPEEGVLMTPNVREGESSDVGERGDLGLLVLRIIGPDIRDKELHHVRSPHRVLLPEGRSGSRTTFGPLFVERPCVEREEISTVDLPCFGPP